MFVLTGIFLWISFILESFVNFIDNSFYGSSFKNSSFDVIVALSLSKDKKHLDPESYRDARCDRNYQSM